MGIASATPVRGSLQMIIPIDFQKRYFQIRLETTLDSKHEVLSLNKMSDAGLRRLIRDIIW